jgi:hypothetical protein
VVREDIGKVYIISFPKVGRTWVRVLIGKYLCEVNDLPEELMLDNKSVTKLSNLPITHFDHNKSSDVISYKLFSSGKSKYENHKVILLTREIKDTLVSCYFEFTRRTGEYKGSISEFIRDDIYGAKKFLTFYRYWYESKHVPKEFFLISYEELHEDAEKVLYHILKFIGVDSIDQEVLQEAVNFSSFENLRKMEADNYFASQSGGDDIKRLTPGDIHDPESFKVRKGKVGGYKEYLSREDIEYIDNLVKVLGG